MPNANVHNPSKKESKALVKKRAVQRPAIGDICFVKIRGFVEWPAIVMAVAEDGALVKFFNAKPSEQYGEPKFASIYGLEEGLKFVKQHYPIHKGFTKAVKEMALWLKNADQKKTLPPTLQSIVAQYTQLLL